MTHLTRKVLPITLILTFVFTTNCNTVKNANSTQKGGAIGAVAGAGLGALIGGKNNRALGALIGAAVGGGAGAIIGNQMDKQARDIQDAIPGAEVKRTEEGIQVVLDEKSDVTFDYNSASLTQKSQSNLATLIPIFSEYKDTDITVIGYTDSKGSDEYNLALSKRRATSVVSFLKEKGIANSRFKIVGLGEAEPRATNDTEEGRAKNRRVEFVITANQDLIDAAKKEAGE